MEIKPKYLLAYLNIDRTLGLEPSYVNWQASLMASFFLSMFLGEGGGEISFFCSCQSFIALTLIS
jgi:hypothetical protein